MVTVLAGQNFDLMDSPESIVRYLIEARWNLVTDGAIPAKSDITFSLLGWTGRKSYQISVEPFNAPIVTRLSFGQDAYVKYNDPITVHVWILKNKDEVPPQMHHITQKIEQIILENVTNVGYGIDAIKLTVPFSTVDEIKSNQTEVSLWHSRCIVELLYFKVTTGTLQTARVFKTHKYDIANV
jgi:hypothetical protein